MKSEEIWKYIHSERAQMAQTWAALSPWPVGSCLLVRRLVRPGYGRPHPGRGRADPGQLLQRDLLGRLQVQRLTDRAARRVGAIGPDVLIQRLRARTTTNNHPPAPVMAMLGEIVVHGEDIRRPLGL